MKWFSSFVLTTASILLTIRPTIAAEFIIVPLGKTTISISLDSLERYGNLGEINPQEPLATYLELLNPEQRQSLRTLLQTRYTLPDISIQQFVNSPLLMTFLTHVGTIIKTQSEENGADAIRTSLIQVGDAPNGFTILEIMRQFPSPEIRLNVERTLATLTKVFALIRQTQAVTHSLEALSKVEAQKAPMTNFSKLPDLRQLGKFNLGIKQTITVNYSQKNRQFQADIYRPEANSSVLPNSSQLSYPVIVISHGLASNRSRFEPLAKHLTSYGFVVVVPQHPGSDYQQFQSLLKGEAKDLFEPEEFVERPRDITELLNHLETLNTTEFNQQLNLQNVGVIGHSLGGYTALTLAGATLNFTQLKSDCQQLDIPLNPSLFLQCRALELPQENYSLQDPRVKAIFILNPVNSSLLGQSGLSRIKIPVFITASTDDFLAPALLEQLNAFTWLTTPDKYLVLQNHATHFYDITSENASELLGNSAVIVPTSETTRTYIKALSTAFFKTYLNQDSQYKSYLHAAYTQTISDPVYPISLIQSLTPNQLKNAINQEN